MAWKTARQIPLHCPNPKPISRRRSSRSGLAVDPASASGAILQCPNCGTQFFPPASEDQEEDSEQEQEEEKSTEEELSELRIRQLITLGRTAYRTRSYLVVGTLACFGFAVQLTIKAMNTARDSHRWGLWPITFLLFAGACVIGCYKFGQRVADVQRGINADRHARELEEAEAAKNPPDLSTLSDGSQHARNLEKMFEDPSVR
jgi:hypothetical protein